MRIIKSLSLLVLVLVLCTVLIPAASAHRVHLREQVMDVQIKAWYGGGDPMANANVEIYSIRDEQEKLYLEGKTDENGLYNFTPELGTSSYRVVVELTGHSNELEFDLTAGSQQPEDAELPLYLSILVGFGFLAGIGGIAAYLSARKMKAQ
jgi:nickel transport protein